MSTTVSGGYYLSSTGKPMDANGKPVDAIKSQPEGVNAFTLKGTEGKAVTGPAVRYEQAGAWFTAFDAEGNAVNKVQGGDAFFAAHPDLEPEE